MGGVRFVRGVLEVCGVMSADSGDYSCVLSMDGVERDTADFEITITQKDGELILCVIVIQWTVADPEGGLWVQLNPPLRHT